METSDVLCIQCETRLQYCAFVFFRVEFSKEKWQLDFCAFIQEKVQTEKKAQKSSHII